MPVGLATLPSPTRGYPLPLRSTLREQKVIVAFIQYFVMFLVCFAFGTFLG